MFGNTVLRGDIHKFWTIRSQQRNSWLANKLIKWKDSIAPWFQMEIGNGSHTRFWSSPWSPFGRLKDYLDDTPASSGIPSAASLCDLWSGGGWRLPPARSEKLVQVQGFLSTLTLNSNPDSYLWKVEERTLNKYSTGTVYNLLKNHQPQVNWAKLVWISGGIPRHSFFTWLMVLNRCPTRDRLLKWGLQTNTNCLLCNLMAEDRNHLYFDCEFSWLIWKSVCNKLRLSSPRDWISVIDLLSNLPHTRSAKTLILWAWQATLYFLWLERNTRLHRDTSKPPQALLLQIDSTIRNRASSHRQTRPRFASEVLQQWLAGGPLRITP